LRRLISLSLSRNHYEPSVIEYEMKGIIRKLEREKHKEDGGINGKMSKFIFKKNAIVRVWTGFM
jgi:hypothetical protein